MTYSNTVSVHVVTYNSGAVVGRCLAALFAQEGVDFRLLVVDNHSEDDTLAEVARFDVQVVQNMYNVGYAAAHNQAIAATQADNGSEFVLTLNPDVALQPGFLRAMVDALRADPGAGMAAGCLLRVESLDGSPTALTIDGAGLYMRRSRRQGLRAEGLPVARAAGLPRAVFGPDGAAALYRRAMLDDVRIAGEVFDEDFFMHKEDIDLCWRAALRGWRGVYVPEARAWHIRGFRPGARARVSPHMRLLGVRNRYLLMLKNEHPAHFLRDVWAILPYDAGIVAYLLLRERGSLRALADAWRLRGRMLHKRRMIQSGRRVGWREVARWFKGEGG
jgi:GT2 family glycosyltransferase